MTPEELSEIAATQENEVLSFQHRIHVCTAASCLSSGGDKVKEALAKQVNAQGLDKQCLVKGVGCMGLCAKGPLVSVKPDNVMYQNVNADDAPDIVKSLGGSAVSRIECATDQPFFRRQVKIVLENSGRVDPEKIGDYIGASGYEGLLKALTEFSPGEVIEQVLRSGLRGRGGAGYPTGLKWSMVSKADSNRRYIVCNGDEGDPGAFMDRSVLEGDPHRVLEGMTIAGYAVGASQGYIYVRAEYPLAIKNLKTAIRQAQQHGLLGTNIFGTTFSFNIDVRLGAGAFVCGEETALIASIEGRRGAPRTRPPYPAQEGLWGEPTLINNVETFANIPPIMRNGGDWFARIGTEKSKGTKVFALAGRVANTGLIEVPMGISLREIIFEIGGGVPDGRRFKAVQTGGPSGGCIPEESLDMPVEYESLKKLGSIMGSGGMIVMDDSSCMVDVAKFFMEFCKSESCGKCVPCRVGTYQMYELLQRMTEGSASAKELATLEELCDLVQNTSLCGLGQSAPNPVLSTLRYFRDEYDAHIKDKTCPANVCQMTAVKEVAA